MIEAFLVVLVGVTVSLAGRYFKTRRSAMIGFVLLLTASGLFALAGQMLPMWCFLVAAMFQWLAMKYEVKS